MRFDLSFIGAGNMAEAIVNAVLTRGLFRAEKIIAADPSAGRLSLFAGLGVECTPNNTDACDASTILLCVKPQMMAAALNDLRAVVSPTQLIITIAAGVSTASIEQQLPPGSRVVRVMPNTPMLVGEGAAAICGGRHATSADLDRARNIFETAATVVDVSEDQMDTVTAVSGSGPAYFFYLVEHMIAAATNLGLSPIQAQQLVYQTASGAAKMLAESNDSPADLRRKVTSPGGTTAAAIEVFEKSSVGKNIEDAIAAAQRRGRELGAAASRA